jgi:hypothetical protein
MPGFNAAYVVAHLLRLVNSVGRLHSEGDAKTKAFPARKDAKA